MHPCAETHTRADDMINTTPFHAGSWEYSSICCGVEQLLRPLVCFAAAIQYDEDDKAFLAKKKEVRVAIPSSCCSVHIKQSTARLLVEPGSLKSAQRWQRNNTHGGAAYWIFLLVLSGRTYIKKHIIYVWHQ